MGERLKLAVLTADPVLQLNAGHLPPDGQVRQLEFNVAIYVTQMISDNHGGVHYEINLRIILFNYFVFVYYLIMIMSLLFQYYC